MADVNKKQKGQYHHGDLRRALIQASVDLVAESGVEGFTLREAAKRAGVSAAAPYRHFSDRADLLAAVATEGFDILLPALQAALDRGKDDSMAALALLGRAFVDFGVEHPSHFKLMYGPHMPGRAAHPELGDRDLEGFGLLYQAVTRAQEEGRLAAGDPRQMALVSFAFVYGAVSSYLDGEMTRLGFSTREARTTLEAGGIFLLKGLARD